MKNKTPDYDEILNSSDSLLNTCLGSDCTGLIPKAINSDEEADTYKQIYPYITAPEPPAESDRLQSDAVKIRTKPSVGADSGRFGEKKEHRRKNKDEAR